MNAVSAKPSPELTERVVVTGHLVLAVVLLVGILITGYGVFRQNNVALVLGLAITAAGVYNSIVRLVLGSDR